MPRSELAFLLLAAISLLGGCQSNELEVARVRGVVTLDGIPLEGGTVLFTPQRGRSANGTIGADGSFTLTTYGNGDGAIVGVHQVAVFAGAPRRVDRPIDADVPEQNERLLVPQRYRDPHRSGLTFEVKSGELNEFELKLTSEP